MPDDPHDPAPETEQVNLVAARLDRDNDALSDLIRLCPEQALFSKATVIGVSTKPGLIVITWTPLLLEPVTKTLQEQTDTDSAWIFCRSAALARDYRGLKAGPTAVFTALAALVETRNTY